MTEKAYRTTKGTMQSSEARSRTIAHSRIDDSLSGSLTPEYTKQAIAIDGKSSSWVLSSGQADCSRDLKADEDYEHVARFPHAFFI